jgi:hypothetical protein
MRRILLSGVFVLSASVAHAQAQGGPDPAKPTEAPAEPAPGAAAPDAPTTTPTPAPEAGAPTPSAPTTGAPTPTTEKGAAGVELNAGGPSGPAAAAGADTQPGEAAPKAPTPPPLTTRSGQKSGDESAWKFDYHGYLRAPMKLGIGKRLPEDTNGYGIKDQGSTTLHEASVPDNQYLSFQSTSHNANSWGEAFFSFGNSWATGVLGIGAYSFTEAGFSDPDSQWGISQGYVLLTPDLGYENVRLWAKAGAIVDKYGMAGRYDAGEYDTYMFGRTHLMGETVHIDYDLTPSWTLYLEQGFGTHKPDPSIYNSARYTLMHHEHIGIKQGRDLEFGAHYLMAWSQEEYRPANAAFDANLAPRNGLPTGHLWVAGAEARAELGAFGYIYGAFSHVGADYAVTVSRALEVLHSSGGGEFDLGIVGNYLESPNCLAINNPGQSVTGSPAPPENWIGLDPNGCSDGNGAINALQAQYEFSLTNFNQQISGGQRFWGHGFDVILKLYGMLLFVDSEARNTATVKPDGVITDAGENYSVTKAKFGADVSVQALSWLSPGLRFDRVMPNNHIPEQSFAVLSPRLQFKSQWVTHERITLGYSRYFYDQRECEPALVPGPTGASIQNPDPIYNHRCTRPPPSPVPYDGFGSTTGKQDAGTRQTGVTRPDENVFKIEATMWW